MTKTSTILKYMETHTGITQMDAYNLCYATRLSAIIWSLKKQGYVIETVYHRKGRGLGYAEYRLVRNVGDNL